MSSKPRKDTREAIMVAATNAVMADGYNALSFRDLASEVGVKSASVHHHFPTKGDLAEALVNRFCAGFSQQMEPLLDRPFAEAIDGYVTMFRSAFLGGDRICLGGMMSAEVSALPPPARAELKHFAEAHRSFLRVVLAKQHPGMAADALEARATAIFAAMEGAQIITHGLGGDPAVFDEILGAYRTSGLLA